MSELAERGTVADVTVVVVTLDAEPWIESCLASVGGSDVVVVDHGSTDGTLGAVRRVPGVRLLEQENRGLAAGWNLGLAETSSRYVLLLNSDAWLVGDALERLVAFAEQHPDAAIVGPRLRNPDGTLQRSVRGFPTLWRLATEYLFLRKLAPRSQALNAFYAGGFDHGEARAVEWLMGACLLVRSKALEQVGPLDEDFFLFSEETDLCYRAHAAGWTVWFVPGAECVHVGGATHGGRMFRENLRGTLRFFAKHLGPRHAARARRILLAGVIIRGLLLPGGRGRPYREAARWLRSARVEALLARS
jgi:GT2 family glycosyltransferase